MRNFILLVCVTFLISSCAVRKKPTFVKVDNVTVVSFDNKKVTLLADAVFNNPNDIGGTLSSDGINVWVNGARVAKVTSKPFKIPAKKEFAVPMKVEIPTKKIFKNNKNGILGGLIDSALNKSIKIRFRGDLEFKVLGFTHLFPINSVQEIKVK